MGEGDRSHGQQSQAIGPGGAATVLHVAGHGEELGGAHAHAGVVVMVVACGGGADAGSGGGVKDDVVGGLEGDGVALAEGQGVEGAVAGILRERENIVGYSISQR